MPPSQQIADSLWHCLCPSFARATQSNIPKALLRPRPRHQFRPLPICLQSRPHSDAASSRAAPDNAKNIADEEFLKLANIAGYVPHFDILPNSNSLQFSTANRNRFVRRLRRYGQGDTEKIYALLGEAAEEADPLAVENWVRYLITIRGVKPDARIYAALLKACTHHQYGSVAEIRRLLQEMEHNGVSHDNRTYEAALKALACHPSYTLRTNLLEQMKSHWVDLSTNSWHYIICGLLREKQIELALEALEVMQTEARIEPQTYLLNMLVHVLAEAGEFDAMTDVLSERRGARHSPPSKMLWLSILAQAAKRMHYPVVSNVWALVVSTGDVNPSTGLATMVLDNAARAGDETLAMDVFRILGQRSSPIHGYHHEALIEAHLRSKTVDMLKILTYVAVVERTKSGTVSKIVRPPFLDYLQGKPSEIQPTIEHITALRKDDVILPIQLLNTVLEAAIRTSQFSLALATYTSLHQLSISGTLNPSNRDTFQILLEACGQAPRKSAAMFLAAEMVALEILPDSAIYEHLILACLAGNAADSALDREVHQRHFSDATRYYAEMISRDLIPAESTYLQLGTAAAKLGGDDAELIQRQMVHRHLDTRSIREVRKHFKNNPYPWKAPTVGSTVDSLQRDSIEAAA